MLKPYASSSTQGMGRLHPEQPTPYRNDFARDRDRIIHANAFKRLQGKTQVFINHEGDHYRNRLTHSIEVSTIARSLCNALGLIGELAEAIALAHDLGHSPFGHAGERALNKSMEKFGGFSHNTHSFKILTSIEQKYAAYNGLNLTWEVLEGLVKHNGPLLNKDKISPYIINYNKKHDLELQNYPSLEAQIASSADDIAYISHDLEDSIKAKIITFIDLEEINFINNYIIEIRQIYPDINDSKLIYEVGRKLIHHLINSLLSQTKINLKNYQIKNIQDVYCLGRPIVEFTSSTTAQIKQIKEFLIRKVYRHPKIIAITFQCEKVVKNLFELYSENIDLLPPRWRKLIEDNNIEDKMSIIADYIAGMTDRFAIKQYQSFYNLNFTNNL